ncbi:MAG: SpoIVB peptidase [Emergencia sp.]
MMKERLKRCAFLFAGILVFVACTGILLPEQLAVLTSARQDQVVAERVLVPGGQSVGIQMNVKGALIVGVEKSSGPQVGDMIVAVNGQKVDGPDDVNAVVAGSSDSVELTVVRDRNRLNYTVKPYYDRESCEYKLGLWIKEKIAGIGTLTFYDPQTNRFGCLGHGIYETETGTLLKTRSGSLLNTRVNQIKAGERGTPGEIGGVIYDFEHPIGTIEKNTEFGVYGEADNGQNFDLSQPVVMGRKENIREGDACILTTIDGTEVEKFSIRITRVRNQKKADSKGLEFEVTDEKLLEACGGIVQGMSGSPILQDGRLIGAVTHVLVNDPTKGYGIFIENMLDAAE